MISCWIQVIDKKNEEDNNKLRKKKENLTNISQTMQHFLIVDRFLFKEPGLRITLVEKK